MKIFLSDTKVFLVKVLRRNYKLSVLFLLFLVPLCGQAQKIAIKTNALNWLTISPNVSAEFVIAHNLSLDLSASANFWTPIADIEFDHLSIQPELRYWFGRPMSQHFVGFTLKYLDYDFLLKTTYHEGQAFGGGFTYGYDLVLTKRWNLEFTAGVGVMHRWEKEYGKDDAVPDTNNGNKWCLVPIKLGVTVSYVLF